MQSVKQIQLVLSLCAILGGGAAFALPPEDTRTTDINAYIGGSSSQDGYLERILSDLCLVDTVDVYLIGSGSTAGTTGFTLTCRLDVSQFSGLLSAGSATIAFHKNSTGSSQGLFPVNQPVLPASTLSFLTNTIGCALVSPHRYNCQPSGLNVRAVPPDAGLLDVEPRLFVGQNLPSVFSTYSTDFVGLTVLPTNQVPFAPIVNEAFRDALQAVQGLTVGAEDVDNVPSLTTPQLAAIFTGRIGDWSRLLDANGVAITASPAVTAANLNPQDTEALICDRPNGSGAKAAFRANIVRQECVEGAPATLTFSFGNPELQVNQSSGNMDACVDAADVRNTNGNPARWAIGYNATRRNAGPAYSRGDYRFIKLDGVAATSENAIKGIYTFYGEAAFLFRTSSATYEDTFNSGDLATIYAQIAADLATPGPFATTVHEWGSTSYLALTDNAFPATPNNGFDPLRPVTPWTKSSGMGTDNCIEPRLDVNQVIRIDEN